MEAALQKLTRKQEQFCRIYVQNGFNAKNAAIEAGYSKKTAYSIGNENLNKPELKQYIENLQKPINEELELSAEWVQRKLKIFSEATITDYFDLVEDKKTKTYHIKLKDLTKLPKEKLLAIESIEETKEGKIKIKLVDKRQSVVDIGRSFNMFKDGDITNNNTQINFIVRGLDKI